MMKRSVILLAGIVLLLATAVGTASADPAKPPQRTTAEVAPTAAPTGCTSTNVCFWVNIDFNDGPGQLSGTNPD